MNKNLIVFPQLIAQIHADIQDARQALDLSPFVDYQKDRFLVLPTTTATTWIGEGGGDEIAS